MGIMNIKMEIIGLTDSLSPAINRPEIKDIKKRIPNSDRLSKKNLQTLSRLIFVL